MRTHARFPHRRLSFFALAAVTAGCAGATAPEPEGGPSARPSGVVGATASPLLAAEPSAWTKTMASTPAPKSGCFEASQQDITWSEVPCERAPVAPRRVGRTRFLSPARVSMTPPDQVGGAGRDRNARVTNLVWAQGSFTSESGGTDESDDGNGSSHGGSNSYSLQMNTNQFASPGLCDNANCVGWEQFIYDPQEQQAFIEFSLIGFQGNCGNLPDEHGQTGWASYTVGTTVQVCWYNSQGVHVPFVAANNLTSISMIASTSGGTDTLTMIVSGTPFTLNQPSILGLSGGWNDAEFNLFGENGGSQAVFLSQTTSLEVEVQVKSSAPTRAAPICSAGTTTAESNTLTMTGACCAFGGDVPGVQFLESNIGGAPVPACPALTATPSPVAVPSGSQAYATLSVVGNLVGQSSNAALQPKSCSVVGPVTTWQNTAIAGEEWFFSLPSSVSPGSTLNDAASCDIGGPGVRIPILAENATFFATPGTLYVAQGSCGNFQVTVPSGMVPPYSVNESSGLPAGVVTNYGASGGGTTYDFGVCPTLSTPVGTYPVALSTTGNVPFDNNNSSMAVNVTACVPASPAQACMSGAYHACGTVSLGCGQSYNCAACAAGTSCSSGVCCPSGTVGTGGTCCPSGEVYYAGLGCMAPCATGTIPCPVAGACVTPALCTRLNNGGQPPNCAKTHTCM
jgi:hypothetical protein